MDQRREPAPESPAGYLTRLPARVLLNRHHIPHIAVASDGRILYANTALADLLGYEIAELLDVPADNLIVRQPTRHTAVFDALREAGGRILGLAHNDQSIVRVLASPPLLMRNDDPIALVALQDVTELLWELQRAP